MLEKTAEEKMRDGGANTQSLGEIPEKKEALSKSSNPGYRSQREVDAAFKKRLSALREKWENEQKEKEKDKIEEEKVTSLLRHIEAEAERFFDTYPDVDIAALLSQDPLFSYLLMKGKGLIETYAFLYDNQADGRLRQKVEQEVLSNLKARNLRPHALPAANSGGTSRDIARLSDAEILRIDSRVKNGERVTL
ncbi:MAG: hypothetical protein AB1Z19_09150 [Eubacteriales bacterium]